MKTNTFLPVFIGLAGKPLPGNNTLLDESTLCGEDKIILHRLGFHQHRPDPQEPAYSEHSLSLGNRHLLNQVEITIAGNSIDVWAREHARGLTPGQKVMVHARPFTWRELGALLKALTQTPV